MLNDNAEYNRLIQGCESELLHLSGAIQPFGAMVRIDPATKKISHASKNLAEFINMSPEDALGRTVETLEWLPPDSLEKLAAAEGSMLALIHVASDGSARIDANLIRTGDGVVVEFEKALAAKDALAMFAYQHPLMRIPDTPEDLKT